MDLTNEKILCEEGWKITLTEEMKWNDKLCDKMISFAIFFALDRTVCTNANANANADCICGNITV